MESFKTVHLKHKFPHGVFAMCGRDLNNVPASDVLKDVTCKNCRSKYDKNAQRALSGMVSVKTIGQACEPTARETEPNHYR